MTLGADPLAFVARIMGEAKITGCLIGGHAVNAWAEPRFTADIDLTVLADAEAVELLKGLLIELGYRVAREVGEGLPSGPDFVRFAKGPDDPPIDVQAAKTSLQVEVVNRARRGATGLAVATPEDLIVLKLIAFRSKAVVDLRNLVMLPDLDWDYVERWSRDWDVSDRLAQMRAPEPAAS